MRKDASFEFGSDQIKVQEDLKTALIESPALHTINYMSLLPVILAVNASYIAVGFHLCQCDNLNPQKWYYNRFCSIMLHNHESCYSQPQLKIYGLYHALHLLWIYLIGIQNFVVEVDAAYIKEMLSNLDIKYQSMDYRNLNVLFWTRSHPRNSPRTWWTFKMPLTTRQ